VDVHLSTWESLVPTGGLLEKSLRNSKSRAWFGRLAFVSIDAFGREIFGTAMHDFDQRSFQKTVLVQQVSVCCIYSSDMVLHNRTQTIFTFDLKVIFQM
jgi:hypothetical protein